MVLFDVCEDTNALDLVGNPIPWRGPGFRMVTFLITT